MTLSELAVLVSQFEGKKKQVDIAQIKEILKILVELDTYDQVPVLAILGGAMLKELKKHE